MNESFKNQGKKLEYSFLPWKRAYLHAKKGKFEITSLRNSFLVKIH